MHIDSSVLANKHSLGPKPSAFQRGGLKRKVLRVPPIKGVIGLQKIP